MNDVKIFESTEFGSIRTLIEDGKVIFCGSDVAKALGYRRPSDAISAHCKGTVKRRTLTNGGVQTLLFISKGDVYRLVAHSRLPAAEKFESWIFDEVLPTIEQTGGYVNDAEKFVNTYLPFADEPTKTIFKIQFEYINQLNSRIRRDEPKVKFADHVADTSGLIDMNGMAKICADHGICIGRNRLFAWLRMRGILMANNLPYQEYIDRGHFKVKESVFERGGKKKVYLQTYVTGKGQQFILLKIMGEAGGDG